MTPPRVPRKTPLDRDAVVGSAVRVIKALAAMRRASSPREPIHPGVPPQVSRLVSAWRAAGSQPQPAIAWPRERWIDALPDHERVFRGLPDTLGRGTIRHVVSSAIARGDVLDGFLACMAWGYGQVGYGPHRVAKILDNAGDTAHARLSAVAIAAASGRAVHAYGLMADTCRLEGLGPAFGTKFIYFVDRRGLILDRVVALSFAEVSSARVDTTRWDSSTYAKYLDAMSTWAGALRVEADELEQIMFMAQSKALGNQWAS